ncbi:unnamed protein product [Gongylonema pulchrum]|uniref:Ig-like domain-containing protein n=1 Tax=Gongylonema pulchrum TaxID=637853 RepID=A0A183CVD7_9BILA|nr:unnamed protein product [Gongylonema pulchrum]
MLRVCLCVRICCIYLAASVPVIRVRCFQELDLSQSSLLRIVEQFAFSKIPNLRSVNLNDSLSLIYVSPRAFVNNTMLLHLSNCALEVLPDGLLARVSRGSFDHNPLQCSCIAKSIKSHITRVRGLEQATCSTLDGASKRLSTYTTWPLEECRPEPVLPFGDSLNAIIGEQFSIYCAPRQSSDSVIWRFPNRTDIPTTDDTVHLPVVIEIHYKNTSLNTQHLLNPS